MISKVKNKILRLQESGFPLSRNDRRVVIYGQLLTSIRSIKDIALLAEQVEHAVFHTSEESTASSASHAD